MWTRLAFVLTLCPLCRCTTKRSFPNVEYQYDSLTIYAVSDLCSSNELNRDLQRPALREGAVHILGMSCTYLILTLECFSSSSE